MIREAIKIMLHPNNMNREDAPHPLSQRTQEASVAALPVPTRPHCPFSSHHSVLANSLFPLSILMLF
jgi:hypothetical protein